MKYLLLISLFISCSKTQELEYGNGLHYIKNLQFELLKLKEIEWEVGRKKDKTISQGIFFEIEIPKLDNDQIDILHSKYGIDSWLFKVEKQTRRGSQDIGHIEYRLANFSNATTSFSVKVLYHAASISTDFRRFHCPAFKHRALIKGLSLDSYEKGSRSLYTTSNKRLKRKTVRPSFTTISFSGGTSLKGKIVTKVAFFNSKRKKIFGNFVASENAIVIPEEEKIDLPSCIGIKEEIKPLPESRAPGPRDLEVK